MMTVLAIVPHNRANSRAPGQQKPSRALCSCRTRNRRAPAGRPQFFEAKFGVEIGTALSICRPPPTAADTLEKKLKSVRGGMSSACILSLFYLYFPMRSGGCERWTTAVRFNTSLELASILSLWNPLQIRYQSFGMIFLRSANRATRPSGGSFRSISIYYFSDSENAQKRAVQLFFDSFNIV